MIKRHLIGDLKKLWSDLKRIYPACLAKIFSDWKTTLICIFIIFSCFYLDGAIRTIIYILRGDTLDELMAFGRWYGDGQPVYIMFLIYYLIGLVRNKDRMRETGMMVLETYIFSGLLVLFFKSFFGRW